MSKLSNSRSTIVTKLAAIAALGLLGLAACSSSSGGSTPPGTYCSTSTAGTTSCAGYTNLNSDQKSAVTQECTSAGGTIVSSCPSGDVGCCSFTAGGITENDCYYSGTASTWQSQCTAVSGTWTAGSGGGNTDGGSTNNDSGGSTGGGVSCSENPGGAGQVCYTYSNLSSAQQSAEQSGCTGGGGTVESSCPTTGLVGSCAASVGGLDVTEYYYYGQASDFQSACTQEGGTWTDG